MFLLVTESIITFAIGDIFSMGTGMIMYPALILCEDTRLIPAHLVTEAGLDVSSRAFHYRRTEIVALKHFSVYLLTY